MLDFILSTREDSPSMEQSKAQSDYVKAAARLASSARKIVVSRIEHFAVARSLETG